MADIRTRIEREPEVRAKEMKTLKTTEMLCPCCMERHAVQTVSVREHGVFKNVQVEYCAEYCYCDKADETYADERQISLNDIAMKDAYREKTGVLTSRDIAAIRARYGISQSDMCNLLGWGAKTITRYESHQVQDCAHDMILRKIGSDSEWFLQLLHTKKESFTVAAYNKYLKTGMMLFEGDHDLYLRSAIMSRYAGFFNNKEATGGKILSLDVVADMIRYYANSSKVTGLFRAKLMKLLWYADALSYKRRGSSISGLVYRALPAGAVPIAHESIVDLSTVPCEETDMDDGTVYRFLPTKDKAYPYLNSEDTEILNAVIRRFGKASKDFIADTMHREDAYIKTTPNDIIQFKYAETLSLS